MKTVRTRFAPSPTGYLHVGGIRTALFAWLVARQAGGQFILRIEDTDRNREVQGAEQHIIDSLKALGLDYDEGPDMPGEYGPYRQSERLDSYKTWAQTLIDSGRAYADPYTPEEVQTFREEAQKAKKPFLYRNHRPENPPEWDGTMPLRFKSDPKSHTWQDAVMGERHAGPEVVDDFILIKSDGYPTYNFAHIIDDHEMAITHVIRGQEFLSSIPNYLNLYEALGFEVPILATMPHILNEQGNKKLSKRDGAKDILDYFKQGFLEEAMLNFIASLGWNDGTTQEIFSRQELIKKFSLDRVQHSGARFDEKRLEWMNGHWIRDLNPSELYQLCESFWPQTASDASEDYKKQVLGLVQERLKYLAELPELTNFFFEDLPLNMGLINDNKQLKKLSHDELKTMLETAKASLEQSDFSQDDLTEHLNQLLEATGQKPGVLFSLIRVATTQAPFSPALADTLHVLGKDKSLARIDQQLGALA
ncbi:glutamate--tRNA ligase [Candidatus Saccharibacteria bacterium]|nr:glutamate--tRNA ligase [Candidatus Saccharibacteria bacterium]